MEKLQLIAKDIGLNRPINSIDIFEFIDENNYEGSFELLNGQTGHIFKYNGIVDIQFFNHNVIAQN